MTDMRSPQLPYLTQGKYCRCLYGDYRVKCDDLFDITYTINIQRIDCITLMIASQHLYTIQTTTINTYTLVIIDIFLHSL